MQRDEQMVQYALSILAKQGYIVEQMTDMWENLPSPTVEDTLTPLVSSDLTNYMDEALVDVPVGVANSVRSSFPKAWWVPGISKEVDVQVDRHRRKFFASKSIDVNYISPAYIIDADLRATDKYFYNGNPVGVYVGGVMMEDFTHAKFVADIKEEIDDAIKIALYKATFGPNPFDHSWP